MSFSNEIKNELAHMEHDKKCCEIAELAGLVRMDGTILIGSRKGIGLELVTENAAVARKAFKGLKKLFQVEKEITVHRRTRLKKNNVYLVRVPGQPKVMELLDTLGLTRDGLMYNPEISDALVKKECCKRSYFGTNQTFSRRSKSKNKLPWTGKYSTSNSTPKILGCLRVCKNVQSGYCKQL